TIAAQRLGIVADEEALRRLERTVSALERIERFHGFFLDWIDPCTGKALEKSPYDNRPIEPALSAVDNAWLATGLIDDPQHLPRIERTGRRLTPAHGLRVRLRPLRRG